MKLVRLAFVVALAATACGSVEVETHRARNETAETLYIFAVGQTGEYPLGSIKPGFQRPLNLSDPPGCYTLELIARTSAGREVARHSGPFCLNQTWLITDTQGPSTSP